MAEYIEREAALVHIKENQCKKCSDIGLCGNCAVLTAVKLFESIPAADVRPVVRGEWKEWWPGDCALIMTGEEMLWACSECGSKYSEKQNYCPNCGADMREPTKEEI